MKRPKIRCRSCRRVIEVRNCLPADWVGEIDIFSGKMSTLCPECQKREEPTLFRVRERYRQLRIEGKLTVEEVTE
ncbi:MAG: hypothetical protein DDT19_00263 [Syntrophomonadaceae bacterium]|nr:hypothetical protein [Bacillota bacterium]